MHNARKLILAWLAILLSWVLILWSTKLTAFPYPVDFYLSHYLLRMAIILAAILLQFKILHWISGWELKEKVKSYSLSGMTIIILITLLEGIFTWIPQSNGFTDSLSGRNWLYYYWEVNELGYRDASWPVADPEGKIKIFVLGDSYVAGHGLNKEEQRFSNKLQKYLPDSYQVFNLGENGANTPKEYKNLVNFPYKPDILILVHIPNDIQDSPDQVGGMLLNQEPLKADLGDNYLFSHSYFFNFMYWKVGAFFRWFGNKYFVDVTKEKKMRQIQDEKDCRYWGNYLVPERLHEHFADLEQIMSYCDANNVKLMTVLFPQPWEEIIDFSEEHVNQPLDSFFTSKGVPVLNTYTMIKALPLSDRIVSYNDSHPGVLLNSRVAEAIYEELKKVGYLNGD